MATSNQAPKKPGKVKIRWVKSQKECRVAKALGMKVYFRSPYAHNRAARRGRFAAAYYGNPGGIKMCPRHKALAGKEFPEGDGW